MKWIEYNGMETWGQLSTRLMQPPYQDPKELQRLERVAVGRICKCGKCICCAELKAHKSNLLTER